MAWPTASAVEARTGVNLTDGVTDYGLDVGELLEAAKARAEEYCDRKFDEGTLTETHDGGTIIRIGRPPIVELFEVRVEDEVIDDDYYWVYSHYVRLKSYPPECIESRTPRPDYPQAIEIYYRGGYSDDTGDHRPIPADLKEIITEMSARHLLVIDSQYRMDRNAAATHVGQVRATYKSDDELYSDLFRRLDKYRLEVL